MTIWSTLGRGRSIAASRSASAGRVRPARRAAAKTASWAIRMPPPSAATSGIHELPGAKPVGTTSWSASSATIASASGRPASRPSTPATSETISASPAISRRTWCGAAPSARSTATSRRRWTIASVNVPATTNSATDAGDPAHRPEDGDERGAVGGARVAGVGVGRVLAVEHLEARAARERGGATRVAARDVAADGDAR